LLLLAPFAVTGLATRLAVDCDGGDDAGRDAEAGLDNELDEDVTDCVTG